MVQGQRGAMALRGISLVAATALLLVLASSASATVRITGLVAQPISASAACTTAPPPAVDAPAGAHRDLCVSVSLDGGGDRFGGGDDARNVAMHLPPGLVGNPTAAPTCAVAAFKAGRCAADTQVGAVTASVETLITMSVKGEIFNLAPSGAEPARLGLQVADPVFGLATLRMDAPITIRTTTDSGLDTAVLDVPRSFAGLPIEMRRISMRLWGSESDHPSLRSSFVTLPTDCAQKTSSVDVTSWQGSTDTATASFTPTGCDQVPFEPAVRFSTDTRRTETPTALTASITFPEQDEPRVQAHLDSARIVMPLGIEPSPSIGSDPSLVVCTAEQLGLGQAGPAACPAGSRVGEARFASYVLPTPLAGSVYLAEPEGDALMRIFILAELGPQRDAPRYKFAIDVEVDDATGQMSAVIDDLPPLPFTDFDLTFRGGDTAVVSTPRDCGTASGALTLLPDSGGAARTLDAAVTVDEGCGDNQAFSPSIGLAVDPLQAGADASLSTIVERPDRQAHLSRMDVSLPTGLLGRLGSLTFCPVAVARAAACPPESRIGRAVVSAGPGGSPVTLTGDVFLTEGINGSLAGMAAAIPARLGPIDLGTIVTVAEIRARGTGDGLDIVSEPFPSRIAGIPVAVRRFELALGSGFAFNATSCAPKEAVARFTSDRGQAAASTTPYQPQGCERLGFKPQIAATVKGPVPRNAHPEISAAVRLAPGQSNASKMRIALPAGLSVDFENLSSICTQAQFEARACPPASAAARLRATTPVWPTPLEGVGYVLQRPGAALPELGVQVDGPIPLALTGSIEIGTDKRLSTVFAGLPDVPLSEIELTLTGGPKGLLVATKDLCTGNAPRFDGTLDAHSGAATKISVAAQTTGCRPSATVQSGSLRDGRPAVTLRADSGQQRLSDVRLRLPSGMRMASAQSVRKRLKLTAVGGDRRRARVTVGRESIRVRVPAAASVRRLTLRLDKGAVRVSSRLRRARSPRLGFEVRLAGPGARTTSTRVSARPPSGQG